MCHGHPGRVFTAVGEGSALPIADNIAGAQRALLRDGAISAKTVAAKPPRHVGCSGEIRSDGGVKPPLRFTIWNCFQKLFAVNSAGLFLRRTAAAPKGIGPQGSDPQHADCSTAETPGPINNKLTTGSSNLLFHLNRSRRSNSRQLGRQVRIAAGGATVQLRPGGPKDFSPRCKPWESMAAQPLGGVLLGAVFPSRKAGEGPQDRRPAPNSMIFYLRAGVRGGFTACRVISTCVSISSSATIDSTIIGTCGGIQRAILWNEKTAPQLKGS